MNLAPNGKPSNLTPEQYRLVRTPEFKKWFGDWENSPETASKVVDENGEPLVVYHGGNVKNIFDKNKIGVNDEGWYGYGFYFTEDMSFASEWGKSNPYFILIKKPFEIVKKGIDIINPFYNNSKKETDNKINEGYDGSFAKLSMPNEYVVYYEFSNQIKLADGTNTTFDSNNPDIRYAGGGSLTDVNVSYANDQQVNELYDLVSKSNELGNVGHPRLVLIQNNKVIGGIFVDNDYLPYEYMFDIFIKNSKRGKGYSKLLLDAMIKDFVENFPEADQIRGWVINKKLEYYLESKYNFWCADDNEEQILYCYLSKKDAEKLLNNKEFKKGGSLSKTPAPKRERIYGSKVNKPKSSESKIKASSIVLSPKVIASINTILEKHNEKSKKKISLSTAKAVVRRGMGAYSSTHRPTIKGGKPNSRVAWGLARLNAFVYKIQKGYSKSGRYTQDDDLINELGYKVKRYEVGGEVLLALNGKPSNLTPEQYRLVRTPAFKAWFGDWENSPETASKVVDYNGEPLPVYHGTNAEPFEVFYDGSFFTDDYMNADGYASGEMIYEVFLNIKKPLIINAEARKWDNLKNKYGNSTRDIAYELDTDKYDGVIFNNINDNWFDDEMGDTQNVYFSTNANQIKLADGTNTTFDGNNPDVRFDEGGNVNGYSGIKSDGNKNVVYSTKDYKIAVDNVNNARYITLWFVNSLFELDVKVGSLALYKTEDDFLKVQEIDIQKSHRGKGMATKMYLMALKYSADNIKGIKSYLPDRVNKRQIPKIYKRLNGKIKGDWAYIYKSNDIIYADGGEITLTTEQVENKLGRKLHWWNDDVVTINGIEYQKVFLRNEYKIK